MGLFVVGTEKSREGCLCRLILDHVDSSDMMMNLIGDSKHMFKEGQEKSSVGDHRHPFEVLLLGLCWLLGISVQKASPLRSIDSPCLQRNMR